MADFNFITIPELRQCLESDFHELQACLKARAWKAVHVLAGSIVEAVLIDSLQTTNRSANTDKPLNEMLLSELIPLAKANALLADETIDLTTVIRKYRNLIHPGRVTRLEKQVDQSGAVIAAEVVNIVLREVETRKRQTYGHTAEQLLQKLNSGATALPLVKHLVKDSPFAEVIRLLTHVLPETYYDSLENPSIPVEQDRHLVNCYRAVFGEAAEECRKAATRHFYSICRNEAEWKVILHEDQFFRSVDLEYLESDEIDFVKSHLLARVTTKTIESMNETLIGIGKYLSPLEADSWFWRLYVSEENTDVGRIASGILLREYGKMERTSRKALLSACSDSGHTDLMRKLNAAEISLFGANALPVAEAGAIRIPF